MRLINADEVKKMIERAIILETGIKQSLVTKLVQIPTVDQWHYPSRGELPPRGEQVLCWLWNGNYCLAYKREDDEWTTNGRFTFDGVRCWQYIIPPVFIPKEEHERK